MCAHLPDGGTGNGPADPLAPGLLHGWPPHQANVHPDCVPSSSLHRVHVDRSGGLQLVVMVLTATKEGNIFKD